MAAIAFFASLTYFLNPTDHRFLRNFCFFLFVNLMLEGGINLLAANTIDNNRYASLSTVLDFTFYFYMLRAMVYRKRAKNTFMGLMVAYPLIALINIFFIQRTTFHTITYSLGCLLIVASCIYYFWELFQQNRSVTLGREPAFWICSGLLFYYACTFPIYGLTNLMSHLPKVILRNLYFIFILLNIFQYLTFTIAYLCRVKTRKSMSSF